MRLSPEYLETLRDLPMLQVARDLGLELTHGRTYCLWHPDKHPSLTFSLQLGIPLIRHDLPEGCKDFGQYFAAGSTE